MGSLYLPQEWPLDYPDEAQFRLGRDPSGAVGATARLTFVLNNRPHHVYGIRFAISYELPNEFERENYDFRERMRMGGTDKGFRLNFQLSQSNVTSGPTDARAVCGVDGTVWHAFQVPLRMRGGNNIAVELQRVIAYPVIQFGDPLEDFEITPTVQGVLVTGQMLSDAFPEGPPGSSGIQQ